MNIDNAKQVNDSVRETQNMIDRWRSSIVNVKRKESELNSAQCELSNATNALGKRLCPEDARAGEVIGVWHGDTFISVTKIDQNSYHVVPRGRSKS